MKARLLIAAALLIMCTVGPAADAATMLEMSVREDSDENAGRIGMTVDEKLLRMDMDAADGKDKTSIIFRGDRQEVIILDHLKAEAVVFDKETTDRIAAQLKQAMEQMEQMMANVPPDQQEMMKQMMKGKMPEMMGEPPAPVEIRKTSETGTTNGYSWVKHEAYQDGAKIQELLVTDWSNLDVEASDFDAFKGMAAFFEDLAKSFGSAMPVATENPFEQMNRLDGFPVVTRQFSGGVMTSSTELKNVTTGEAKPGTFENPGYKVQKIDPGMGR